MGKKSKRAGRNKLKRSSEEKALARLHLPIPLQLDDAHPQRNHRQLADHCLENLPLLEKQDERRFILFPLYLELAFSEEDKNWTKHDVKFLKKIADDEDDLTYFRVESLHHLAGYHYRVPTLNPEAMTDCLKDIVELCKNAPELEKAHRTYTSGLTVGEHLAGRQHQAEECGVVLSDEKAPIIKSRDEIAYVPIIAGNQCDNCLKTKAELNVDRLATCGKCALEYYCSSECQLAAWKNGHKHLCRKKGVVRPGDQAHDTSQKTERHVQLVQYLDEEDSWVVVDLFGENRRTVPTEKLERLRPALWQCTETLKFLAAMSSTERQEYFESNDHGIEGIFPLIESEFFGSQESSHPSDKFND